MRPNNILFLFLSLLCFVGSAQTDPILLRPENGKEYFYEFTDKEYLAHDEKIKELVKRKTLHIKFSNVQPEDKELLQVNVIDNRTIKPLENPQQIIDYQYPYSEGNYFRHRPNNFYKELLCGIEFLYEFDYNTSEVKLYNRTDILLAARDILRRKKFNKEKIDLYTEEFNKKGIPEITACLNSIYQLPQDFQEETNQTDEFDTKLSVQDSMAIITAKRWDRKTGLNELNISFHTQERYLKQYHTIKADTVKSKWWVRKYPNLLLFNETNIRLLKSRNIGLNTFTITGKIEGTKLKKFTLASLRKPYGRDLIQTGVHLEDDNTLYIQTELKHPGIILLEFGRSGFDSKKEVMLLYAEPGGTLKINSSSGNFPNDIEFNGDFANEAILLNEFREMYHAPLSFNLNILSTNMSRIPFAEYEKTLDNFDLFFEKHKDKMEAIAFEFLKTELKAQLLCNALSYIRHIQIYDTPRLGSFYFPEYENVDAEKLETLVENFDIAENYNEYGIYSRLLMRDFYSYKIGKVSEVRTMFAPLLDRTAISYSDYRAQSNFPLTAEFGKLVLSGHAYYSFLAEIIQSTFLNLGQMDEQDAEFIKGKLEEYTQLMLRQCNNREFTSAIKQLQSNYLNWENKAYIPGNKFFNPKGEEVHLNEFTGEKPCVFYVSNNWGASRYHFDDLAKENTDINFVMVMQGNNFQEWKEYMERAEPVAKQVFLMDEKHSLNDIFSNDIRNFIVYDANGARYGVCRKATEAKEMAKESLQPVKKKN